MTTDIATLGIKVDSTQAASAASNLDRMAQSGERAESAVEGMQKQVESMLGPLRMLQGLLAGVTAALGIQKLIEYADTWNLLNARIKIVSRSTHEFVTAQRELFRISQETRTALEGTVSLYTRVAGVAQRAGRSQVDVLKFTETVSKGLQVSGASAGEAQNTIIQLGQALASGALRGDEFNSLRENAGALVQVLADNIKGVDGNMGKLREFAEQGKLTFDVIFNAALRSSAKINADYAKLPVTVGAAFTTLENAFMKFVGEVDKSTGITAALSSAIVTLGKNIDLVAAALGGLAAAGIAASLGTIVGLIRTATSATIAWTAALAANPIGLVAVGIAAAVSALIYFRNETVKIGDTTVRVGNVIAAVWTTITAPIQAAVKWLSAMMRALAALVSFDFSSVGKGLGDGAAAMRRAAKEISDAWGDLGPTRMGPSRDMGADRTQVPGAKAEINDKEQLVNAIERIIGAYDKEKKIAFEVADARKHLTAAMEAGSAALKKQIADAGGVDSILKRYEAQLRANTSTTKEAEAAVQAFTDKLDDAKRFLLEQAGGLTEAERAFRPYAAQIEGLNDLLTKKGITDQQRITIQQTITELEIQGNAVMEETNRKLERQKGLRDQLASTELARLRERNDLMTRVAAGGQDGLKAGVELQVKTTEWEINDRVRELTERLREANGTISDSNKVIIEATEAELKRNAALDRQIKTNELALTAADSLGNVFSRIASGDPASVAEGIGDFVGDFKALEKQTGSSGAAFAELGKNLMESAEAGNALGNIVAGIFGGRSAEQKKNAQTGGAIGSTAFSMLGLPKGVGAFIGNTIGGLFGMSKADERAIKLAAEVNELSKSMNAFVRAGNPLKGIAADLAGLDADFNKLRSEAVRLKQPLEEITKSYEAQRKKIVEAFGAGIDDIINRLTGNTARADFDALIKVQDQRIKDALLAEYDLAKVRRANALELEEFFSTLTEQQLEAFGNLATALDRIKARIRDLTATVNDQLDTQIDLAKQLAQQARQQAQSYRQLAASLREQIGNNLTGDLSPLSPGDRFNALNAEFTKLFDASKTGDLEAGGKLADAGTKLLEAARAMYATSPEYVAVFDRVQAALAQVAVGGDVRATALERIADLADTQVVILERIQNLLSTDLGKPTADAIAAAIADGVLTVEEIDTINGTLDDIYNQFVNLPGSTAAAVRSTIDAIRPQLVAGTLTDAQKTALTTGQGAIALALNNFKADQLEQYRLALVAAGSSITSISDFLLDPEGRIPAAIEAAFSAVDIDLALTDAIEGLFTDALGGEIDFPPLVVRAEQTVSEAVGEWTSEALSSRINTQFGTAIATWTTSSDPRTLVERVDAIFQQAVGGTADWQVSLTDLLNGQSPLVTNLQTLTASINTLTATLASRPANDNSGQTAYDAQLQSYVTGVQRAASAANTTLSTIPFDDRSGSHNNRTNLNVDASTGATTAAGGSHENDSSRQRAAQLAAGLAQLAQQIQTLSGGTLGTFQIQASEEKSGYQIGSLNRLNTFGGNDFEGIARNFVADAVNSVQGGNAGAISILQGIDWSNLTRGFSEAATSIYQLLNPRPMAAGGLITGGIPGRDSVPILGMPGERMLSVPQSTMLETIYSAVAGRSRGQVATDPALLSEMRALRASNETMAAELAAYRKEQAARDERLIKSNEEMAKDTKKQAGGRGP